MSSSIIARLPNLVGKGDKVLGRHGGYRLGIVDTLGPPDVQGVGAGAEKLQPLLQAGLLGFQRGHAQARPPPDQKERDVTETRYRVVGENDGPAAQPPRTSAPQAPTP